MKTLIIDFVSEELIPVTVKIYQEMLNGIEQTYSAHGESPSQFIRHAIAERLQGYGVNIHRRFAPSRKGVGGKPSHRVSYGHAPGSEIMNAASSVSAKKSESVKKYPAAPRAKSPKPDKSAPGETIHHYPKKTVRLSQEEKG